MSRPACAILLFLAAAAFAQEIEFEDEDGLSLDEAGEGIFLFAEAEDFALEGGWKVCDAPQYAERGKVGRLWPWWENIGKAPHLASGLRYAAGDAGSATWKLDLPHGGKWRVWVRQGRKGPVSVNGMKLEGLRLEPGDWGWERCVIEASKGPFALTLTSAAPGAAADAVVVTDDVRYEPDIRDFRKFYLRIRHGGENASPAVFIFPGEWHRPEHAKLKPGEATDWIDVSKKFVYGVTEHIGVTVKPEKPSDETHFEVDFSWDGKDVAKTFRHQGRGAVVRGLVSTARQGIASDVELSAADLRRARDVSEEHARRPKRFGVSSTMALNWANWSPEAVENELEVFRILGLNGLGNPGMQGGFAETFPDIVDDTQFLSNLGDICSPDEGAICAVAEKVAKRNAAALAAGRKVAWGIMDEFGWGIDRLIECKAKGKTCTERFREYLAASGLKPSDFGAGNWSEVSPVKDYGQGLLYYWTARYRDHVVADFFATVTRIAREIHPNLCPTANMGTELVFNGNLAQCGMNLFELCDTGSMRHIQTEDWANLQRTYQHCSYQCDVLRAAGRRANVAASMLNVISGRSDWEIAAKAFSEAGRGVKDIIFFRYGPGYAGSSDSANGDPRIYRGIRAFCDATAPVEDYLMDGSPLKGDAALLLSVTGDRWQILSGQNEYGKERMSLSLMLNHLGVRTDVLCEEDLSDRLKDYRQLFAADRNILRACVKPICDWLKAGGVLVLGPRALSADEANAPIDVAVFEEAGKVLRYDFSPRKDYLFAAKALDKTIYSKVSYPEEPRERLAALVAAAGIVPAVKASDPLVEAQIVESPHGRLLVISNWRCEPVKVVVSGPALKESISLDITYGAYKVLE